MLIEVARALRAGPTLLHGVILLIDDAEEVGSLGAVAFAEQHPSMRDVVAVVNVDNGGTSGNTLLYETGPGNFGMVELYANAVARPASSSIFSIVHKFLPRGSDFSVFERAGLPGLNFAFAGDEARYHTARDTVGSSDPGSLQLQGDTLLATTRALARSDLAHAVTVEGAWFDLFGRWLVRWPVTWSLWAAFAALALLALAARRARLQLMASGLGALAPPVTTVVAGMLAFALQCLLGWIGLLPAAFVSSVWPLFIAMLALGFGCVATLARLLARCDPRSLAFGNLCTWALVASACAASLPGASVLFLPVVLIAAPAAALLASTPYGFALANGLASLSIGAIWFPSLLLATDSFGIATLPVFAAPAAWIGCSLLPGLAALPPRRWFLLLMAAGAIGIVGLGLHALLPRFDATAPERVNVIFYVDGAVGPVIAAIDSAWIGPPGPLPRAMRAALERLTQTPPRHASPFAWRAAPAWFSPLTAAAIHVAAPIVTKADSDAASTSLRAELAPNVRQFLIVAKDSAPIRELRIGGRHWPSITQRGRDGVRYRRWALIAPAAHETLQIAWQSGRAGPTELSFIAESAGVPTELEALVRARPAWAAASQAGDRSLIATRLQL